MSDILDYGKENVLDFIQTTIKHNNNVKYDNKNENIQFLIIFHDFSSF